MLNFGVLSRWASRKEVATCWYEYPINPVKPWAEMLQLEPDLVPLRQRQPHQLRDRDDRMMVPMTKQSLGTRRKRYPNSFYDVCSIVVAEPRICR
jgi:hypothetical protein